MFVNGQLFQFSAEMIYQVYPEVGHTVRQIITQTWECTFEYENLCIQTDVVAAGCNLPRLSRKQQCCLISHSPVLLVDLLSMNLNLMPIRSAALAIEKVVLSSSSNFGKAKSP